MDNVLEAISKIIDPLISQRDEFNQGMFVWQNAAMDISDKLEIAIKALEVIASNGNNRGMGWTPAQHARLALEDIKNKNS